MWKSYLDLFILNTCNNKKNAFNEEAHRLYNRVRTMDHGQGIPWTMDRAYHGPWTEHTMDHGPWTGHTMDHGQGKPWTMDRAYHGPWTGHTMDHGQGIPWTMDHGQGIPWTMDRPYKCINKLLSPSCGALVSTSHLSPQAGHQGATKPTTSRGTQQRQSS